MSVLRHRMLQRARQIGAALLVPTLAVTIAVALAPTAGATEEQGADGVIQLAPVEDVVPESITSTPAPVEDDVADSSEADPLADEDLDQPLGALRRTRAAIAAEREALQTKLLRLEAARSRAEDRLDAASDSLARHLVARYEAGASEAVDAIIAARDEGDPDRRAALLASMDAADRRVIVAVDEAHEAVRDAASRAESTRAALRAVTVRISAIDAVIEDRRPLTARERDREQGRRYSIDADLVFTTGAIPGIGYWGPAAGGSMLTGWTGFAGAALGGVGCTAPDPKMQPSGTIEVGEASWYGPGFHGNNTANGETYDQNAMTAAHQTLPFGSIVRVFSSATGRCAFVRINDRGPFVDGRIIDLSHAAATAIGMSGVAPVQIEVWSTP